MAIMKPLSLLRPTTTQLLQLLLISLLSLTVLLNTFLPYFTTYLLTRNPLLSLSLLFCLLLSFVFHLSTRPRPTLLLNYSCYLPPHDRRCSFEVCEYFARRSGRFSLKSESFMRGIYHKSGLGDETYAPPFIFDKDYEPHFDSGIQEVEEGMFSSVDALLEKTNVPASLIDTVVVTCGMFSPSPSLTSHLVNRYCFHPSVKTFNLAGMGCGSGAMSVDLAAKILSSSRKTRYALVVVTECIGLSWYFGEDRSMLVTNCIFRVGSASALLTNDPARRRGAKMELLHALRTHRGADEASYTAAFQCEDEEGLLGVALKKDLVRVAGEGLGEHIRSLAPRVLPLSQILVYAYCCVTAWVSAGERKARVPDFAMAFEHMCIHTGGKAVIESVARVMKLKEEVTEPARMTLHRFGNTSSSLVFYELAYYEAKGRVKEGDRMWMLAFGTGFKVCSLVWRSLKDWTCDVDNPWNGSIHRYPHKAW